MNDLISRQAAIDAILHNQELYSHNFGDDPIDKYTIAIIDNDAQTIAQLPSAQPEQRWIPVRMRPMDSEEREYWEEQFGEELADEDAVMFDCPMPEDGQEILVSYRKWISMDKCEIDGGCYGLEGNGDWEDVVAWMPLPEPYKEEHNA